MSVSLSHDASPFNAVEWFSVTHKLKGPHGGFSFLLEQAQAQGDVPTFYTYEEGLSHLTAEGQATLDRLEGMLAQSVAQQFHMAGVRTDQASAEFEGLWFLTDLLCLLCATVNVIVAVVEEKDCKRS